MKTAKVLAILVLVLGLVSSASADLVAHYEFEADGNDSSGNGLHGILFGGATIVLDAERGNVLSLDGAQDYILIPDNDEFDNPDGYSFSVWFKLNQLPSVQLGSVQILDNLHSASPWRSWRLGIPYTGGAVDRILYINNNTTDGSASSVGPVLVTNRWYHVAGVFNGSYQFLYVDGVFQDSDAFSGTLLNSDYYFSISRNATPCLDGKIDDIRIYNNALSAAEIADLAGTGVEEDSGWIISGNNMYSGVSGNVGIGTDNPEFKLEVMGDSTDQIISVTNDGSGDGVYGDSFDGSGVTGMSLNGTGVTGMGAVGPGVLGMGALAPGVQGMNALTEAYGDLGHRDGVYGECPGGYAGFFEGDVIITGRLSKGGGSFKIDHPLDPENKYLQHSFVESPDMMNIYNGSITLDKDGQVTVELPEWFGALNKDFRYQLTCIGGFAPVYIAEKISDNRFKIAGGKPGMEVSWQVTGIRRDPYANKHRITVEENKSLQERGYYLHPEAYGLPKEKSMETVRKPRLSQIRELAKKRMSNRYN